MAPNPPTCTRRAPVVVNPVLRHPEERRLSLDGTWGFRLDPQDHGLGESWFRHPELMAESVTVPGNWQGQGFGGDDPSEVRDFRHVVRTMCATYTGTGWYAHAFTVPPEWQGRRLWVNFGGAHPSAEVWLNGQLLGSNDLPYVPWGLEITDLARPGQNDLVVRIHEHNRDLGFTYNWQGNWSGLYRSVELAATGPAYLERLWLWPRVAEEALALRARTSGGDRAPLLLRVEVAPWGEPGMPLTVEVPVVGGEVNHDLPVPSPRLWSPDSPQLYAVKTILLAGETVLDARADRVGFVQLGTEGKHFLINGEPYYLRGSGDFMGHPEVLSPDTDRERWRRKLRVLRDYGYNYVRCQSYAPSPEYFDIADEVGLLVQSELGVLGAWGGHSVWHIYPWPQPTAENRARLQRQWDLVVERDVNHPSANLYCMSNEWGPSMPYSRIAWECDRRTKAIKPTAFVIWSDGGSAARPDLPADFDNDWAEAGEKSEKPLIQHEFAWWSSFPDVRVRHKYSGEERPYAIDIAQETAARHGISHVLPQAAANSQRLQALEAKLKLEARRRDFPTLAGICHFDAMDANPSPQGIVNAWYEPKVTSAATWRETNGDTVILCSLGTDLSPSFGVHWADNRIVMPGETFRCSFLVSDFSHPPFADPVLEWRLRSRDLTLGSGSLTYAPEPYRTCLAGEMQLAIPAVKHPLPATLEAALSDGRRRVTNHWALWVLPEAPPLPEGVVLYSVPEYTWLQSLSGLPQVPPSEMPSARLVLTERLDDTLIAFLHAGGRVFLAASEGLVRPFQSKLGMGNPYYFTPPAQYPTHEDGQNGTILQPHPMLGDFPHEGWADLQFFRLIDGRPPLDLEPLGLVGGDPVLRVIHGYMVGRPLGYLVEGSWGAGSLILCALGLDQALPEARYLLAQMCAYGVSSAAQPNLALTAEAIEALLAATALP